MVKVTDQVCSQNCFWKTISSESIVNQQKTAFINYIIIFSLKKYPSINVEANAKFRVKSNGSSHG